MEDKTEAVVADDLLETVKSYLPDDKIALVDKAFQYASRCHLNQKRLTGGPFIEHPLETAKLLAELRLDAATIAAALLHDVMEDCGVTYQQLQEAFGAEVAKLVDGVTKLTRLDLTLSPTDGTYHAPVDTRLHAESLRKMLLAMAEDIRVVLVKLADRLHNMKTLDVHPAEKRRAIAQETLDIYAPLAGRLGIWSLKWQLEDRAFRHLNPEMYKRISRMLAAKRAEREEYVAKVTKILKEALENAGVKAQVTGRPKNIYSIYKKMQKYSSQGKDADQIYDLYALRVLAKTKGDSYEALGVVHNLWHPIPGQFDDYIANPKDNLYQSLHTTIMCEGGKPMEVQVRTYEMHQIDEYGVAAHWRYKEGAGEDQKFERKINWLRQLLDWQREVSGVEEFLESVKTDIFNDQVFVYTPKGDIVELPASATPIDFAYKIHTDLGHRCMGAKVNGRLVSLDYQLQNGDTVEIVASKTERGPSLDWLNPDLGYVKTASAINKIKQWFRRQEREPNIQSGRDLLHRELRRLNLNMSEDDVAGLLKYENTEEFLALLGSGDITMNQIVARLAAQQEKPTPEVKIVQPVPETPTGIQVLGVGDLLTHIAKCCEPIPGDPIVGYITRSRGVTVHKATCPNIINEDEKERITKVEWGKTQKIYPVRVNISAWDRVGLLRDVSTLVSAESVNIASVITKENNDKTVTIELTLHTSGISQLSRLFTKLESVRGVMGVTRISPDGTDTSRK